MTGNDREIPMVTCGNESVRMETRQAAHVYGSISHAGSLAVDRRHKL